MDIRHEAAQFRVHGRVGGLRHHHRQIEPALIQDRLDKIVLKQLQDFKKTYRHEKALPAWLYDGPKRTKPKRKRPVERRNES